MHTTKESVNDDDRKKRLDEGESILALVNFINTQQEPWAAAA